MTDETFNRPGAVDLSGLAGTQQAGGSGAYVVEVRDEAGLSSDVVNKSMSVVVLLSIWSPDVPASVRLNESLSRLADEFAGRFLLATLDASAHAPLVAALRTPPPPLVAAALRGQLAPLLQEELPAADLRVLLQQVLQAAAANGITGRADPVARPAAAEGVDDEPPPLHPEAEDALLNGDLDGAIEKYSAALAAAPGDAEAAEGLARAQLMLRARDLDAAPTRSAAAAAPDDVEAQLSVADLDLLGGHVEDAFARLLDLLRRTAGPERDVVRRRLLDLFLVVGDADPRVGTARRALTAALF